MNKKLVFMSALMLAFFVVCTLEPTVFLASNQALIDVKQDINLFNELLAAIISGIGAAVTMWAFMKMGMAMQHGSQGGMEAQSFNAIIGGIVIILAPQLLLIFTTTT